MKYNEYSNVRHRISTDFISYSIYIIYNIGTIVAGVNYNGDIEDVQSALRCRRTNMCLYYHNNNHNHNIMCYNNNNNNTLSTFKTSTTNVIAMPSRRQSKIRQQTTQINSSIKNIFSDIITKLIMHQSGVVVMWWCFILCTCFILDVSGSPVIRIQKDLVSAKDNANSSLNLGT